MKNKIIDIVLIGLIIFLLGFGIKISIDIYRERKNPNEETLSIEKQNHKYICTYIIEYDSPNVGKIKNENEFIAITDINKKITHIEKNMLNTYEKDIDYQNNSIIFKELEDNKYTFDDSNRTIKYHEEFNVDYYDTIEDFLNSEWLDNYTCEETDN